MKQIYLYLKIHNKTGLKYLGKTLKDPFTYNGSGKYWCRHLKKHGNDITTIVLYETPYIEEFTEIGLYYSKLWNIVESKEFANLMPETGTGGYNPCAHTTEANKRRKKTWNKRTETWKLDDVAKENHSKAALNFWQSDESNKIREKRYKNSLLEFKDNFIGPPKLKNHININKEIITCPHCNFSGQFPNLKRWHFDNCKKNPHRTLKKNKIIKCFKCEYKSNETPNFYRYHNDNCNYDHKHL